MFSRTIHQHPSIGSGFIHLIPEARRSPEVSTVDEATVRRGNDETKLNMYQTPDVIAHNIKIRHGSTDQAWYSKEAY